MISRREFLTHSCALGVASATVTSSLLQLAFARRAAAMPFNDYRSLVCILLAGGNDSYNMLVPNDDEQFAEYQGIRADLALERAGLLNLAGTTADGRQLAVHPGMSEVRDLYGAGDLAFVANVGTLVEPFDVSPTNRLPLGLYSHADQIAQWQTALPDKRSAQGWGGRLGDLMHEANFVNGISMNISLSGTNLFQSGEQTIGYSIQSMGEGATGLGNYDDGTPLGDLRKPAVDGLLAASQDNILRREFSRRLRDAIDTQRVFVDALGTTPDLSTQFSDNYLSAALRQIARVIGARDAVGASRQTYFVTVGGWDHHDEVLNNQANMLPMVSAGLKEFRDALVELDVFNGVTTFTISDFGRTLTSNGRGSDHGWGGNHMVMGGSVAGGQIYGDYPLLAANSPLDMGRGIYAPTTSVDEYFAELALWFGVSTADLDQVLPNVRRFYTPEGNPPPLGILA